MLGVWVRRGSTRLGSMKRGPLSGVRTKNHPNYPQLFKLEIKCQRISNFQIFIRTLFWHWKSSEISILPFWSQLTKKSRCAKNDPSIIWNYFEYFASWFVFIFFCIIWKIFKCFLWEKFFTFFLGVSFWRRWDCAELDFESVGSKVEVRSDWARSLKAKRCLDGDWARKSALLRWLVERVHGKRSERLGNRTNPISSNKFQNFGLLRKFFESKNFLLFLKSLFCPFWGKISRILVRICIFCLSRD